MKKGTVVVVDGEGEEDRLKKRHPLIYFHGDGISRGCRFDRRSHANVISHLGDAGGVGGGGGVSRIFFSFTAMISSIFPVLRQ